MAGPRQFITDDIESIKSHSRLNTPVSDILCSVCDTIAFRTLSSPEQIPFEGLELGTLEDILRKQDCPFCRLVKSAFLREYPKFDDVVGDKCVTLYLGTRYSWSTYDEMCGYLIPPGEEPMMNGPTHTFSGSTMHQFLISNDIGRSLQQEMRANAYDTWAWRSTINLVADDGPRNEQQYRLRRIDGSKADLKLASRWLSKCQTFHGDYCERPRWADTTVPEFFRVIDVKARRVTIAPEKCRYVALSYVWGQVDIFKLSKMSMKTQDGEEYIDLPERMNDTVEDAIKVTLDLGERYLWVDALCIVQDDAEEVKGQIANMDAIYGGASLLVVAAAGADANAGLSGVGDKSRCTMQHIERIKGLELGLALPSLVTMIDGGSSWNTRAWTFQERFLCKRSLVFTEEQMFFVCACETWCEDMTCEPDDDPDFVCRDVLNEIAYTDYRYFLGFNSLGASQDDMTKQVFTDTYVKVVKEYTRRKLSFRLDALDAAAGVLSMLSKHGLGRVFSGLPELYLDSALLWIPQRNSWRRKAEDTGFPLFPSWSWAGWEFNEGVGWDWQSAPGEGIGNAIQWYIVEASGHISALVSALPKVGDNADIISKPECPLMPALPEQPTGPYLYLRTSSAVFHVRGPIRWAHQQSTEDQSDYRVYRLSDIDGRPTNRNVLLNHPPRVLSAEESLEFIFLSYASNIAGHVRRDLRHEYNDEREFWIANVMLIERKDGGIAERIAVGQMHLDDWLRAAGEDEWILLG